jgi:hypothetical protein
MENKSNGLTSKTQKPNPQAAGPNKQKPLTITARSTRILKTDRHAEKRLWKNCKSAGCELAEMLVFTPWSRFS